MLNEKKILIVGAGGLLGKQVVKDLLQHQATIIATDINIQGMQGKLAEHDVDILNGNLTCLSLDLNNEQQVKNFFQELDYLDGVVNCTYPRNKNYGRHFFEVSLNDFNENISLHLGSSFLLTQQCAALFLRAKHPLSLVNIASIYGVIPPKFSIYEDTTMTMPIEYAAIKSAIIHINKYVANYVNHSDFRVNSVSPGGIFDNQPNAFVEQYKKCTLGTGMLDVSNITGAILFLLSDYSKYMNGQNLIVDDGFSL